jgi:hypothetical protein
VVFASLEKKQALIFGYVTEKSHVIKSRNITRRRNGSNTLKELFLLLD